VVERFSLRDDTRVYWSGLLCLRKTLVFDFPSIKYWAIGNTEMASASTPGENLCGGIGI
jgi:hypothetical protein